MDCIQVNGIRSYGYTGFLAAEQELGQWFEVDLGLWLDLTAAGQSDRIDDTLDYRQVIEQVKQLISTSKYALLERLATAIIEQLLQYSQISQVKVRLTKVAAPIPDFSGQISIELTRSRPPSAP
ncbi:dihydroneopterin aldolase [Acaryochloris sp. IP29b_bin.148]|uniref:dihydroneopterin aldolase n=1 Tax=Acaryochloris sp. IP29b_bin.148 TaxID=2969218 RepID=UPI00262E3805|nr:dihydroneopterin aldolase [Acaryochloris sp. IP29b_bin.148]